MFMSPLNVTVPVKVGAPANTFAPVPVSSVNAAAKFALVGVAKNVATFVPNPVTPVLIGTVTVPLAPRDMAVPFTVTLELVSDELPILDNVLLEPLIEIGRAHV